MIIDQQAAPDAPVQAKRRRVIRNYARKLALRKFYLDMTPEQRLEFCHRAGTCEGYIHQIYGGWSLGSVFVAQRIEEASAGKIPAWYLRPDVFTKPAAAPAMR